MTFLVAVDGSDEGQNALEYATEIAEATGASITVVHAVDPVVYDEGGMEPISTLADADRKLIVENIERTERRGQALVDEAVEFVEDTGVEVSGELVYGDPDTEIADFAEETGVDAIYVGHRGRSERVERFLGSVAKAVVERASVPVTVVR